jgi:hypothetical protein
VHAILTTDVASPLGSNSLSNDRESTEEVDEERGDAAEELITGDSHDPLISEEAVSEMLRTT